MGIKAVVGLGMGDEGKGITVDYLSSQSPDSLVVRYSGGQQAGHTVCLNGIRHVFSNFGSGTLRGCPTYWSEYCTVDPVGIMRELTVLKSHGINPILFVDGKSPVTTPYDKIHNMESKELCANGTCGVGVGSTFQRESDWYSLTFNDLFHPVVFMQKLEQISKYYGSSWNIDEEYKFIRAVEEIRNNLKIVLVHDVPTAYPNLIFEGSQGLLLDQHYGFFPNVTRSNTGTTNILEMGYQPELYLVTRAYQTRHGKGFMTNRNIPNTIIHNPEETNVNHEYQGKFRRSILDLDLLLYGISKDDYIRYFIGRSTLVVTCLDHLASREGHPSDYRFTHNGGIVTCSSEAEFLEEIAYILGVGNVLISSSPYSKDMKYAEDWNHW